MKSFLKNILLGAFFCIAIGGKTKNDFAIKQNYLNDDVLFSCSYTSTISPDDCIPELGGALTGESLDIAKVLSRILSVMMADSTVKVQPNFFPYACDYPEPVFKALTKKSDSSRYILYSKAILAKLVSINTDWVAYSIFAHEIGHHFFGHSLKAPHDLAESREREIQADFFCGYILNRLRSTLQQAQSGINATGPHPSDIEEFSYSHPTKAKRLFAIKKGFDVADSAKITMKSMLNIDSLIKFQTGLENLYNKTLMLILDKKFDEALLLLNEYGSASPSEKALMLNNRGFVKQVSGDIIGAIKDYDAALKMDETQFIILENRGKLKKTSFDKVMVAEGVEDIKLASQIKTIKQVNF